MRSHIFQKSAYRIFYRIRWHFQNFEYLFMMHLEYLFMQKFAYNRIFRIFPHMRLHFSAFPHIWSNVNTRARVIYAAYISVMPHICSIYAAYFIAYFAKFRVFFPHILHQNGPHILRAMANRSSIDCIYIDFKRAFDLVSHQKLLSNCLLYTSPSPRD